MAHGSAPLEEVTIAPSWDAEAQLQSALSAVDRIRAGAQYFGIDDFATATVGDYLNTRPDGFRCRLGDVTHLSNASKGVSSVNHNFCKRADCPTCCPEWVKAVQRQAFHNWYGAPLYRAVFSSYEEVRARGRGRDLTSKYAGRYLRLAQGYTGEQVLFFPGEAGEGDPVLDPGTEILAALMRVPAYANGKKRIIQPKAPSRPPRDLPREEEQPEEDRTIQMQLPPFVAADQAEEILPRHGCRVNGLSQVMGWELANAVTERITGREVTKTRPYWPKSHFASWTVTGLAPDEVVAIRSALQPLRDTYYAERNARRRKRQAASPTPSWWRG